jgi:hypothetical protein
MRRRISTPSSREDPVAHVSVGPNQRGAESGDGPSADLDRRALTARRTPVGRAGFVASR